MPATTCKPPLVTHVGFSCKNFSKLFNASNGAQSIQKLCCCSHH